MAGTAAYATRVAGGDFVTCRVAQVPGIAYDGGYADYMIAPAVALARIPDGLPAVEAAPLLCAGITTYNALRNSGARPGNLVAVLGLGGLGHLGVQFAARMGFETVAIGRGTEEEPLARRLGVRHYVDGRARDAAAELVRLGAARVILATAPSGKAMSALVNGLAVNGKLVVLGVAGAKQSMINALDAGLDCIEHAEFLVPGRVVKYGAAVSPSGVMEYDERVTERLLRQNTFVSYTFQAGGYDTLVELRAKQGRERLTRPETTRKDALEAYYEMKLGIFSRLLRDGMRPRLVVSSDAGPFDCEFGRMHYGIELAVQAGLSPLQAIAAATSIAARACGVAELTGSVEPGKEADLLVVHGNALDDIRRLADVAAVYKGELKVGVLPPNALLPSPPR